MNVAPPWTGLLRTVQEVPVKRKNRCVQSGSFVFAAVVLASGVLMCLKAVSAFSATVLPRDRATEIVALEDVVTKDGVISGKLVNRSSRPIRDVELLIRHLWIWNNEFRPGEDNRSQAEYYTVKTVIDPGKATTFRYEFSRPLSPSADGYFLTTVSVAGFTEIIPPEYGRPEMR
jgi:hypothetical protein